MDIPELVEHYTRNREPYTSGPGKIPIPYFLWRDDASPHESVSQQFTKPFAVFNIGLRQRQSLHILLSLLFMPTNRYESFK